MRSFSMCGSFASKTVARAWHLLHMQWRRREIVARSMRDLHLARERQLLFFSVARWQALFAHWLPVRQLLLGAGLVLKMWRSLSQTRGLGGTHPHERVSCLVHHRTETFQGFQREASVPPFRTPSVSWISPSSIEHSCRIKTPINHATQNGASRDLDAQPRDHER